MRKLTITAAALLCAVLLLAATPWTSRQTELHNIADAARGINLPEDNPIIREAQFLWWCETDDARMVAKTVYGEAANCTDRHQQLVARTIYNRVDDPALPDTVKGVLTQQRQYSPEYTRNLPDFFTADETMQRCFRNAYAAFMGETECPPNVIYASEYPPSVLGSGCYEESKTYINGVLFSTTYFNFK